MKTLKKTLSLTLVFALVFSLMSMAFAAETTTTSTTTTGYKDAADITYKEAVDVTSAIGVFQGNDLGAFAPKDNLTREQAAKIICYLSMGQAAADKLSTSSAPFADVAADRWSAGSIAYCVQQGIVAGYGNGNFGPNDSVTGYQFEKMLLVALSYDPSIEGFTGNDWQINVAKRAFQNKLSEGNDTFVGTNAANREEAALYVKNTLLAATVIYDTKGTNITTADGTVINIGASAPKAQGTFMAINYSNLKVNGGATRADLGTQTDDFGRISNNWTFKGQEIGKYAVNATLTYTANMNSTTAGKTEVANAVKGCTLATGAAIVVNGDTADATPLTSAYASEIAAATGNGALVQVYMSATNAKEITGVTVIKNDVAVVAAVDAARKTVTLTAKSASPVGMGSYTVKDGDKFYDAVKGLAVGDYVLVTPAYVTTATYAIANVTIPKQVKGYVGAVNSLTNTVYLNGTTPYGKAAVATTAVASIAVDTTNQATLWLDSYGYIVHSKNATAASKNFVYVLDGYQTLVNNKLVNMAKVAYTDGTTADVAVASAATAGLYPVTSITNDVYTLGTAISTTTADAASGATLAAVNKVVALKDGGTINAYDKTLTEAAFAATDYYNNYYSSDVKFIYVNSTAKTATVKSGVQAVASLPTTAYAVVEAKSATDATPVVTAVILVDGVAATVDSQSLIYFGATTLTSGNPTAAPVGSMALMNKTTNKYETFPVHAGFMSGTAVTNGVPTKSINYTNADGGGYGVGFYSYAKADDTGAYVLSPYTLTTGTTAVEVLKPVTATFDEKLITVNGKLLDISSAVFGDVRAEATQAAQPVVMNAAGICAAADTYGLNVSVVYDATTGKAAIVYINSVDTGFTIGTQTSGVTFATGTIADGATDLSTGTAVTLGTTKIPAGTKVYVMAASVNKAPVYAGVTLTQVTAKSATQKGIYSFVMPAYGIADDAFTEA